MLEILDRKYLWSHGQTPRGRGNWGFLIDGDDERVLWVPGSCTLTEAKKFVRKTIREAKIECSFLEVAP